ncbi:MAG: MFS transporter [bacterium]
MSRNIPLFIAFRVFFNARFYYPVLGVLFLDLGLSLEQYATLNVIWAATILLVEIPSGALADVIGRRWMVSLAGLLMVAEMALFAFAPIGPWLFPLLILNRIISGTAEACASGADEALAYDSLPKEGRDERWRCVLVNLMRWSSGAFFIVMITGALAFDRHFVEAVAGLCGWHIGAGITIRWPVYLTLATSVPAFLCALAMREPPTNQQPRTQHQVREALENILGGARFVFSSPRVRWLMLCAVLFDSLVRLFLTFASNYYRLIGLPEFVNGFLGSLYALLGFLAAVLAQRMISHLKPAMIFTTLGILVFAPLVGLCFATPIWGLWVVIPIGLSMPMMQYFVSSYLNEWTESKLRATVLSFRGVALNIGYAFAGIGFVAVASSIRATGIDISETAVFAKTLLALPIAFALGSLMLMLAACGKRKAPIEN